MSETPETDRETYDDPTPGYEVVSPHFARKLERERDEARKLAEYWRDEEHDAMVEQGFAGKKSPLPWENAEADRSEPWANQTMS